jgi:hypothetical protein
MKFRLSPQNLTAAGVLCVVAVAQTPRPGESSLELEPSLFVQLPGGKSTPGAVQLVWIPEPLEKYCLGKTHQQCASMDFCIRTTTKNVSTCRNLAVDLAHLPAYPPDMRPRRMMSIALIPPTRMNGWQELEDYLARIPKGRLERFSQMERIKAKVTFIRTPEDDDFSSARNPACPQTLRTSLTRRRHDYAAVESHRKLLAEGDLISPGFARRVETLDRGHR